MRPRLLLIFAFCLAWSTVAVKAQENDRNLTDEEDARLATIAARQNALTNLLATGPQLHNAGEEVKAAQTWNRAGGIQLLLNKPDEALVTYRQALNALRK